MNVARRFLQDRRRSSAWWGLAMAGLVLFTVAFYPSIKGQASIDQVVQDLPPAVRALLGGEQASLTTAPGYLYARLVSTLLPLVLLVFAIAAGSYAIGGSEEDGTLELVLAQPVGRRRVLLERFFALAVLVAGLTAVAGGAILALSPLFGALEGVSIAGLGAAVLAAGGLALMHGALAFAVGAAVGRRGPATAAAAAVAIGGYLAYGVLAATAAPGWLRAVTPWEWYLRNNMLVKGPSLVPLAASLAVTAALALAAVVAFERRDLR